MSNTIHKPEDRRSFLTRVAAGSAAAAAGGIGLSLLTPATNAAYAELSSPGELASASDPDAWLSRITGKHRQFFDAVTINDGFSLGFALNFLNANNFTYKVPDSSLTAVVGLRHFAAPIGFTDEVWSKYKIGEFLGISDPATRKPAIRNRFYHPREDEMPLPGMSVDALQSRGVIFTVCNVALSLLSTLTAKTAGVSPETARQEWLDGMIPGMNLVAAGVLAVNRAQEKGCTYCAAS